jgi:hypothetical protein
MLNLDPCEGSGPAIYMNLNPNIGSGSGANLNPNIGSGSGANLVRDVREPDLGQSIVRYSTENKLVDKEGTYRTLVNSCRTCQGLRVLL